ncbi:MAG: proton-conducting transporter membrane subunit [Candidatus Euphemobacter frigidus]|nr:proton-conducting transporter membrane subunit [Candidatus Euphemobacter frigidus]
MRLDLILTIAFGGALATYLIGKFSSGLRNFLAVLVSLFLVAVIACLYGDSSERAFYFGFFGLPLILRINALSWFFALAVSILGALGAIFSLSYMRGRERTDFYYLNFLLVNAAMLGVVFSGDLISFFIFWEIMSWSTFLLICYNRGRALQAGMKYIIMSLIGSAAFFIGISSLYTTFGTLVISKIGIFLASASSSYILFLLILFSIAFGIKNAVWPFHAWLPPAHSEAPSPFSAILSGILIKMGTYGFILLFYVIIGLKVFLALGRGWFSVSHLLSTLGAVTILIPTFIAVFQDDAKRLLAWSTIAQVGYIFLGLAFGTGLSVAGGIFHFLNHAVFKALLFFAVGAVEFRTRGERDLNSLGGFIKKMPFTFAAALVGVCGLIGVPLTNGFVSKWMIYKTLILGKSPFLAFAALVGTWGTILYSYKLIHHIFLGQLPTKYKNIQEAPFSMKLPMAILSLTILIFGILPGIPLKVINAIGISFGFSSLDITIWGIASETGTLNTLNIFAALLISGIIAWLVFKASRKPVAVAQQDTYAAGAAIPRDKYNYTVDFYHPLSRMIKPYLRDFIDEFYLKLADRIRRICGVIRHIYTGDVGNYVMYIVLFLSLLIFIQLKWSPW